MERFIEGQKVQILSREELIELERKGEDIAEDMINLGGQETTIRIAINSVNWDNPNIPEYYLEIDAEKFMFPYLWRHNYLKPVE